MDSLCIFSINLYRKKKSEFDISNIESDFDYGFGNFLRSCCVNDRKTEIYNFATEHLEISLDIETLIQKYNEIDMLKKFIFDSKQIRMFETLARFVHAKNFFSSIEDKENIFKDYDSVRVEESIKDVKDLIKRGSIKDKRLLLRFKNLFKIE